MGRDDWWRNTSWNEGIEAAFFNKFARARNKAFYLRNQVRYLAAERSDGALRLLDQYFALGADSSEAEAHFYRARAHASSGDALIGLRFVVMTLLREDAVPNFRTWA